LVDETSDWYKYFKCSEIDPTCLPGAVINAERTAGFKRLFRYKVTHYPLQTLRLLRRFLRHMALRDVVYLILKPFLGAKRGPTQNEVLSRAVEHGALKDAAAELTKTPDELLEWVATESHSERRRLLEEARFAADDGAILLPTEPRQVTPLER
jgi:hypothetical protein